MTDEQDAALGAPVADSMFSWLGRYYDLACYSDIERSGDDVTLYGNHSTVTLEGFPESPYAQIMAIAPHLMDTTDR